MANADRSLPARGARCRLLAESDFGAVASLLANGFVRHRRATWLRVLDKLHRHPTPDGYPRFGYVLEAEGQLVGVILLIISELRSGSERTVRGNVSSWYVAPEYRSFASLLASQALRYKSITYLNVSPAEHTRRVLPAQGYVRYCEGQFLAMPLLSGASSDPAAHVLPAAAVPGVPFEPWERQLLIDHASYGCLSFWCLTAARAHPFVFRARAVKGVIPCAQLIYCDDMANLVRLARPLGRYLARRGLLLMLLDANEAVPGLVGRYYADKNPKYFKGPNAPRLGDLAYTEAAMFGLG